MKTYFDHEKLFVYQESLQFIRWLEPYLEKLPNTLAVRGQLDRCSTSVPLNIAEGNGKFTTPNRCKYFDISKGSTLECASGLDVLVAKGKLMEEDIREGKEILQGVYSKLIGLIRSNAPDRMYEETGEYFCSEKEKEERQRREKE